MADLTLYDSPGSPCARRVRITLIEKGLAYDTVFVDLSRLEQKAPAYLRLNPNGVVPTLVHGPRAIYESNVITEYLDDVFPDVPLYPVDPWERAQVKHWQAVELALAKDFRPLLYQRLMGPIVRLTRPTLEVALAVARRRGRLHECIVEREIYGARPSRNVSRTPISPSLRRRLGIGTSRYLARRAVAIGSFSANIWSGALR